VLRAGIERLYGRVLSLRFDGSRDYWDRRYRRGGDSGAGSYGREAMFKARVVNDLVARHGVRRVVELGCGDGHQLGLLEVSSYLGLDVSPAAVRRCVDRHGQDPSKSFALLEAWDGAPAEMALSLDVIYHLVEDDVYERYMERLFAAATSWVVIYSTDVDLDPPMPHVRHRAFREWVRRRAPDWEEIEVLRDPDRPSVAGPEPRFFVYRRRRGASSTG